MPPGKPKQCPGHRKPLEEIDGEKVCPQCYQVGFAAASQGLVRAVDAFRDRSSTWSMDKVKEIVLGEIEGAREPIYPGTIAIKHGIPYKLVREAARELEKKGVITIGDY
jgi:hypothetical protein